MHFHIFRLIIYIVLLFACLNSKAQQQADSLKNALKHASPSESVLIYNTLSGLTPVEQIDDAISYCYNALRISKDLKNDSLEYLCYNCLIGAYYRKPYFEDSALTFLPPIENHETNRKFPLTAFNAYTGIGNVYLKKHDYVNAQKYYLKAYDQSKLVNTPETSGAALYSLAEVNRKSKNCSESINYCNQLVETGQKAGITWMVFSGYRGIGICFDINGAYDSAETYFSKALVIATETHHVKRMATANGLVGIARWHNKNYTGALEVLHESKKLYEPLNDDQIIPTLQNLCCVYRDMNEQDSAVYYCEKALAEATRKNQQFSISIIKGILSGIYYSKGDFKLSYDLLKSAKSFDDSSNSAESNKAIAELEKKYRIKEKQAEISLLLKEKELNSLQLQSREADLFKAKYEVEEERKTSRIHALAASNKEAQLENAITKNRLASLEKQAQITILKEQSINRTQQRNLVIIISMLAVILFAYVFSSYRQKQKLRILNEKNEARDQLQRMRDKFARDLHDDIGSNLSKISLLSEVAMKFPGQNNSPAELEKIAVTARTTLEQMNDMVWTMSEKNDFLSALLSHMRHYAAEYFDNTGIKCTMTMPGNVPDVTITGDQRKSIFLTFKESLNNIMKHAGATAVTINVSVELPWLKISIHDNGNGFDFGSAMKNGNGLLNMKHRMESIRGSLIFENGNGSLLSFIIPIAS